MALDPVGNGSLSAINVGGSGERTARSKAKTLSNPGDDVESATGKAADAAYKFANRPGKEPAAYVEIDKEKKDGSAEKTDSTTILAPYPDKKVYTKV